MPSASRRRYQPKRYPLLEDQEWLYDRYVIQQVGPTAMAREAGCKTTISVLRALGLAGIPLHGHKGPRRGWEPTKEELLGAYSEAGTLERLAELRGVSVGTIRNVFSRLGLRAADFEPQRNAYANIPQLADRAWLEKELYRKTTSQIAAELGCRSQVVFDAVRQHGLRVSFRYPQAVHDEAIKLYTEGFPLAAVATRVKVSPSMIWRWLHAARVDTSIRRRRCSDLAD